LGFMTSLHPTPQKKVVGNIPTYIGGRDIEKQKHERKREEKI